MLPVLLAFNGEPVVTDDGDLVYIFPELMSTAAGSLSGGNEPAALGAAAGALATTPAESAAALRSALAFSERPAGWRPAVGEPVVIGRIGRTRGRDDQVCAIARVRELVCA